jgi:phosphosulfolactate synthase (CoM biosynthesis protein A)
MMGGCIDRLKFAGGSFTLMPARVVRELIDMCHGHDVEVSTGGFIERVGRSVWSSDFVRSRGHIHGTTR